MSAVDRREYYRLPIRVPVFIKGIDHNGDEFLELTHTINVSASGACFITKRALQISSDLLVSIPAPVASDYEPTEEYDFKFPCKLIRLENGVLNPHKRASVIFTRLLYEKP
jgi:hypothetical protein